ncbi:hypothetical protein FS842_006927 [Serendipita sp. 407]|nr:hypothetical protein FS842_006927 [Serendipita sp. 407]
MREKETRVEYDPPWMPDSPLRLRVDMRDSGKGEKAQEEGAHEESATTLSSFNEGSKVDILIELGAGLGYVGLAAAESMQTLLRNRRLREDDDGGKRISGSNGEPEATHGDTSFSEAEVILTDLPDVCVLLKENAALQMKEWAGRGIEGITSDEDEENIQVVDQKIQGAKGYSILDLKASLVRISVRDLAWGNDEHVQSLSKELQGKYSSRIASGYVNLTILCSDLVYFPSLLAPLLRSLIHLTSPDFLSGSSTQATILMSYRVRSLEKESPFWRAFGTWFDFEPVLTRRISERDPLHNEYGRFASDYDSKKAGGSDKEDKTTNEDGDGDEDGSDCWRRVGWDETGLSFLFRARRKPETLSWICPKDDDKLLYGSRGDDRFEILLMLCSGDATTTMVGF